MIQMDALAGTRAAYLCSLLLAQSSLGAGEFIFHTPINNKKVMHEEYLSFLEKAVGLNKFVSARDSNSSKAVLRKTKMKSGVDISTTLRRYATLDVVTENWGRGLSDIHIIYDDDTGEYRECPIDCYVGCFTSQKTATDASAMLREIYRKYGPAFIVSETALGQVLNRVENSEEKNTLLRSMKKYPEVFR